jgi:hypothetical protein
VLATPVPQVKAPLTIPQAPLDVLKVTPDPEKVNFKIQPSGIERTDLKPLQ